jgi:hypothetical protein
MISASAAEVFGVDGDGGQGGGEKTLGRKTQEIPGGFGPSCSRIASRTGPPISGADSFAISGSQVGKRWARPCFGPNHPEQDQQVRWPYIKVCKPLISMAG